MNTAIHHPARRQAVAAPTAVALVAVLAVLVALIAGRPDGNAVEVVSGRVTPTSSASTSGTAASSIPMAGDGQGAVVRVALVVGDKIATATLSDTPEAREFAAMLPVTLNMDDAFGQAKTSQLPHELDIDHAARSRHYTAGDLSYWSPTGELAIVYDAWGLSVPPPGLVRLGTVDARLDAIASAGNDFTMTMRRVQ
jgi:hypothetical protein